MKKKSTSQSAFFSFRILISLIAILSGAFLALFASSAQLRRSERVVKKMSHHLAGQQEWIAFYNGGFGFDIAWGMAVDSSGNIYVTGSSVGPGPCNFYCNDYATVKYDSSGNQQWVARYDGPAGDDDHPAAIAVDKSGNVYVTGASLGSAWPNYDFATVKYDGFGQQQWVARYNGTGNDDDEPYAIAVDSTGNVYVTGYSSGLVGGYDYTTIKYDTAGSPVWVASYNNPDYDLLDIARAIALDECGNVYVTGWSVGPGVGGTSYDYATVKYDSSGGAAMG